MSSALTTVPLTNQEITSVLQSGRFIDQTQEFHRMKLDGNMLVAGDEVYPYNPVKNEPAMLVRIAEPPIQYQAKWFNDEAARIALRPEIANSMCRSYYDNPQQARRFSEDATPCNLCPFNPFMKGPMPGENQHRCSWKGDIGLQIIPDDGELKGDEPIWTLTLSVTGMIEFRGVKKNPTGGVVSEENFMFKLAKLAESLADEWGVEPRTAVMMALTSYQAGGVVAEVRIPKAYNDDRSNSWPVVSFTPIHIEKDFASPEVTEETLDAVEDGLPIPRIVSGDLLDSDGEALPF